MVTFNEAMLSNDRTLAIRVGDFTSENIKSANFKYGYITGDDFTPGGTYAGTASILFTSIVESFKKLDVVYPEIGLLVGSKVEWVKMGKYYIDNIKIDRNANTTEIELMDEMFKLNERFKTDLKYPAQIRDVIYDMVLYRQVLTPVLGATYTLSFWAKGEGSFYIFFHGDAGYLPIVSARSSQGVSAQNSAGALTVTMSAEWQRYWVTYQLASEPATAAKIKKHLLLRQNIHQTQGEFWFAGLQLERSSIASDWKPSHFDTSSQLATYRQTAEQNYASLQTNLQTLDGTLKQNKSEFAQTANQLRTSISAMEGKIPTEIGGRNLLAGTKDLSGNYYSYRNTSDTYLGFKVARSENPASNYVDTFRATMTQAANAENYVLTFYARTRSTLGTRLVECFLYNPNTTTSAESSTGDKREVSSGSDGYVRVKLTQEWQRYWIKWKQTPTDSPKRVIVGRNWTSQNNPATVEVAGVALYEGTIPRDWSPSPEDVSSDIGRLSSELTQTKEGMTLLATKTELSTAKADLQSSISTATNSAKAAQSTADDNAKTIRAHTTQISALNTGLQAKISQSAFNTLSGRVTTAENKLRATASELSSKITSVEGKIPSEGMNLIEYGRPVEGYQHYPFSVYDFYGVKAYQIRTFKEIKYFDFNPFKVEKDEDYTLFFRSWPGSYMKSASIYFIESGGNEPTIIPLLENKRPVGGGKGQSFTFNVGETNEGWIRFVNNGPEREGMEAFFSITDVCVKKGKANNAWSPSQVELANSQDLKNLQSEFKQTTEAIKASVTSLDKTTVKTASLTINTDGIVMKAGKSTTDVANAIGSYFAVNQNAINLFSDKINVKGSMIVDGAITSTKIASKMINTAHLNGKIITADVISTGAITANAIKAGAVTTNAMAANSINGDRITAGTLDAGKIKAGSITASQIASGTITSSQIKTGGISASSIATGAITASKIASGAIDASKITANAITSNHISSTGITANVIKGGVLSATNKAMELQLSTGQMLFYTDSPALKRILSGYPTQFVKFETGRSNGNNVGVTVIGSNRNGTESSNDGAFVGIRAWNGATDDQLDLVGDTIRLASAAYQPSDGWVVNTLDSGLRIAPRNRSAERNSLILAGDFGLLDGNGEYRNLRSIINSIIDNLNQLHRNKTTQVAYTYSLPRRF